MVFLTNGAKPLQTAIRFRSSTVQALTVHVILPMTIVTLSHGSLHITEGSARAVYLLADGLLDSAPRWNSPSSTRKLSKHTVFQAM